MTANLMRHGVRCLLVAMLLATLAPAISRTLSSAHGVGDWLEVCTPNGMAWEPLSAPVTHTGDDTRLDHCGHCLLAAERFAPLLRSRFASVDGVTQAARPADQARTAVSRCALYPPARGPPLLS